MGSTGSIDAPPVQADDRFVGFRTARPTAVPRGQRALQPPALLGPRPRRDRLPQPAHLPPLHNQREPLVVVAIDFGMTFTGFAFSFTHNQNKLFTWADGGKPHDRVPTTVLLHPNGTLHSFGFDAEDAYSDLVKKKKHQNWKYFKNFKMHLYTSEEPLRRDTMLYDREGKTMLAIEIFATVINFLRQQVQPTLKAQKLSLPKEDVKWLITVPAISSDSAKQFMREAAVNGGIPEEQLHLALEPEAASIYCLDQASQWQRQYLAKNNEVVEFSTGFKFIVADLGGGTADICVYEVVEGGNLKEIYSATGDALWGTYVNQAFHDFLMKTVGAQAMKEIKENHADIYLELTRDFERKKKSFFSQTDKITFTIDADFCKVIEKHNKEKLEQIIPNTPYPGKVEFLPKQNKLKISQAVVKDFFSKSVDGIIEKLRHILRETKDPGLKTLILVGGFSESPYLRECIEADMKQLRVLQERDARLTVLKGAVLLGFKPQRIQERKAQFTYGFYMIQHFQQVLHPQDLKLYHDGTFYCDQIFVKLIEKGETLTLGRAFKYESTNKVSTAKAKGSPFLVRVVKSTKKDPKFCTPEEGCSIIGKITVHPPRGGWPNITDLSLHIIVGETEFVLNVIDKTTGQSYEAEINFL